MYQTYLIVGLIGAVIGALMPAKDGKLILGFIPLRIFNALGMACLLCFFSGYHDESSADLLLVFQGVLGGYGAPIGADLGHLSVLLAVYQVPCALLSVLGHGWRWGGMLRAAILRSAEPGRPR